jgi:3-hydroxyacyl-[acyl-carrier-protein] dehydratase
VRFVFVDRVVAFDPGRSIDTVKNVSSTEDVFVDHFPGYPILPGALIVETFEQAAQLLIGVTHDFARIGRLRSVQRAAFRHFVRPGDQVRVRCATTATTETQWTMSASADVDGRRIASATLALAVVDAVGADKGHADRVRETFRILTAPPIETAQR